jgi:hypothetical protein
MATALPVINIKAQSTHHALFLMVTALITLLITFTINLNYWRQFQLVFTFIYLSELVIFITGLAKYLQPKYSIYLTPKAIKYQHRYGQWQVFWQEIQQISLMNETFGITQVQLPYIGIRLIELSTLAHQISPRLANRLIHEQKPLLACAIRLHFLTLEQAQLNFDVYILPSGDILKGPLAAFMHHTTVLHKAFGYHLFLPETTLDRDLHDFYTLLTQCKNSSSEYN